MESVKATVLSYVVFIFLLAANAEAQQPFYTDDAEVTNARDVHFELSNEFDVLQRSSYPNLRQNTTVYRLYYGLTSHIEIGVDSPVIGIFNAPSGSYRRPFGPGDTNVSTKYNIHQENQDSKIPALSLSMNIEIPTGDKKRQLGSGLVDYWLYGIAQKAITDRTVVHVNTGILFAGDTSTGVIGIQTRGRAFTAGLSVVRDFGPNLKFGAELFAAITDKFVLHRGQLQSLIGGNYAVKKDTTLDFGIVGGHFLASPRIGIQFGVSTTWHNKPSAIRVISEQP